MLIFLPQTDNGGGLLDKERRPIPSEIQVGENFEKRITASAILKGISISETSIIQVNKRDAEVVLL